MGRTIEELRISGSPLCDVRLELVGPRRQVYALERAISLGKGTRTVRLPLRAVAEWTSSCATTLRKKRTSTATDTSQ